MPGRSADKMFWCIVLSLILMFLKDGFIVIAILWGCFFVFVLPKEVEAQKRGEEYEKLKNYPDKYKSAILRARDICSGNLRYYEGFESDYRWWSNELDPETRDYIRKTEYYNHRRFQNIKKFDDKVDFDKKYLIVIKRFGKKNFEAAEYSVRIANGQCGLDKNGRMAWWRKLDPEARTIIRKMPSYNAMLFSDIKYYDEEMKRLKLLPEFEEEKTIANK